MRAWAPVDHALASVRPGSIAAAVERRQRKDYSAGRFRNLNVKSGVREAPGMSIVIRRGRGSVGCTVLGWGVEGSECVR